MKSSHSGRTLVFCLVSCLDVLEGEFITPIKSLFFSVVQRNASFSKDLDVIHCNGLID